MDVRITTALDDVLASRGHLRVLRALDALPEGVAVSVRDLARRAGLAHPRTAEVLSGLSKVGLTNLQRAGRADLYQLNREHVLYPTLHSLFGDEARVGGALEEFLRKRLMTRVKGLREAYLFGSVVRGESEPGSDIDLAVIVPARHMARAEEALEKVAAEVRRSFGNTLSVHTSAQPLSQRVRGRVGRDLWRRVADEGRRLVPARTTRG